MTEQELFDTAFAGMLKQGAYSYDNELHMCFYAQPGTGNRCHVGLLFTPEEAQGIEKKMSGMGVVFALHGTRLHPHIRFLRDLQMVHDRLALRGLSFDPVEYHAAMCVFAQRHGLNLPELPA